MALYFQPTPIRVDDGSLPSAPDSGLDISAIIDELIRRIEQAERKIEFKVDSNSLAKIIATDTDIAIVGDQVSILGQLTIADWVRDLSGNPTGGIDKTSLTRITGGKIQTGIIESVNWSTTQGSQFNLNDGTIVTGGSILPKFSVSADGTLTAQNAIIQGTLQAGSVITNSVTVSGTTTTMQQLVDGIGGSTFDLQGALDAGVTNILAGIGTNFRLDVDTANALVSFRHKDAVPFGNAGAGGIRPAIGLTAAGIAMGFNDAAGAWINGVAIDATGNIAVSGTLTAGSIITNSVTIDGVTIGTVKTNAGNGATAFTGTAKYRTDSPPTNLPVISTSAAVVANADGGRDITLTWAYTQGTLPADGFAVVYKEGTAALVQTDASIALPITSRTYTFQGVPADKAYRAGIVAWRRTESGIQITAIVQPNTTPTWQVTAGTVNYTGALNGTTASTVVTNASNGNTAATNTIAFRTTGAPSNVPVLPATPTTITSSAVGTVDIQVNWTYTQGSRRAERFVLYVVEGTSAPTTSSDVLAVVDGNARSYKIQGVPMDKNYRLGITAERTSSDGIERTAIVTGWARDAAAANITANIDGTSPAGVKNTAITLGSTGVLSGAGGGSITNLDYSNVGGTKPPASATQNLFTTSTSNPSGGVTGDAHWNSSTSVMWFNTAGTWKAGGTVNASEITTGTLSAARIAANSITSDKINVTTLSAVTANLGTVNAGSITGSAGIDITGIAKFKGSFTTTQGTVACSVNEGLTSAVGLFAQSSNASALIGQADGSGGQGVFGISANGKGVVGNSSSAGGEGVRAQNLGGGNALRVVGPASFTNGTATFSSTISGSITGNSGSTSFVSGGNVSGAVSNATFATGADNANKLGTIISTSWCRLMATESGTAIAAGSGFQFGSSISGVGTAQSGAGNRFIVQNVSDRSLKQNIEPEILGADFVHKMAAIAKSFEYKERPGKVAHGWIAQDVAVIKPTPKDYMSHTHDDGLMGVDYNSLISILYYNLSAAFRRIDALESKTRMN